MARPLAIKTVNKLNKIANKYFLACDDNKLPYTMSGLAAALGISRSNLSNYANKEQFSDAIAALKQRIEAQMEERMLTGQNASTPSIFSLKNNFQWHDKQQVENILPADQKHLENISSAKLLEMLGIDPANMELSIKSIQLRSKRPSQVGIVDISGS